MPSNHSTYPAPTTNADDDWNAGESLTTVAGWVEVVRLAGAAVGDTVSSGLGCYFHGFGLVLDTAGRVGVHVCNVVGSISTRVGCSKIALTLARSSRCHDSKSRESDDGRRG